MVRKVHLHTLAEETTSLELRQTAAGSPDRTVHRRAFSLQRSAPFHAWTASSPPLLAIAQGRLATAADLLKQTARQQITLLHPRASTLSSQSPCHLAHPGPSPLPHERRNADSATPISSNVGCTTWTSWRRHSSAAPRLPISKSLPRSPPNTSPASLETITRRPTAHDICPAIATLGPGTRTQPSDGPLSSDRG